MVFTATLVWLEIIMQPCLCSTLFYLSCSPSANQYQNYHGQISLMCWIMVRQLTECSLACFLSALEFNWACVPAYHAIKLQCHRPCACSASTFAICLCSVSILRLRLKKTAPDIIFDCSDIPGFGGEETEGKCTNKSGEAWVTFCDALPTKPPTASRTPWQSLIDDCCYCRTTFLWSFNKVCF